MGSESSKPEKTKDDLGGDTKAIQPPIAHATKSDIIVQNELLISETHLKSISVPQNEKSDFHISYEIDSGIPKKECFLISKTVEQIENDVIGDLLSSSLNNSYMHSVKPNEKGKENVLNDDIYSEISKESQSVTANASVEIHDLGDEIPLLEKSCSVEVPLELAKEGNNIVTESGESNTSHEINTAVSSEISLEKICSVEIPSESVKEKNNFHAKSEELIGSSEISTILSGEIPLEKTFSVELSTNSMKEENHCLEHSVKLYDNILVCKPKPSSEIYFNDENIYSNSDSERKNVSLSSNNINSSNNLDLSKNIKVSFQSTNKCNTEKCNTESLEWSTGLAIEYLSKVSSVLEQIKAFPTLNMDLNELNDLQNRTSYLTCQIIGIEDNSLHRYEDNTIMKRKSDILSSADLQKLNELLERYRFLAIQTNTRFYCTLCQVYIDCALKVNNYNGIKTHMESDVHNQTKNDICKVLSLQIKENGSNSFIKTIENILPTQYESHKDYLNIVDQLVECTLCNEHLSFEDNQIIDHFANETHWNLYSAKQIENTLPENYKNAMEFIKTNMPSIKLNFPSTVTLFYICCICDFVTSTFEVWRNHLKAEYESSIGQYLKSYACSSCKVVLFGGVIVWKEHCLLSTHTQVSSDVKNLNKEMESSEKNKQYLPVRPSLEQENSTTNHTAIIVPEYFVKCNVSNEDKNSTHENFLNKIAKNYSERQDDQLSGFYCSLCNIYMFYGQKKMEHTESHKLLDTKTFTNCKKFMCVSCNVDLYCDGSVKEEHMLLRSHKQLAKVKGFDPNDSKLVCEVITGLNLSLDNISNILKNSRDKTENLSESVEHDKSNTDSSENENKNAINLCETVESTENKNSRHEDFVKKILELYHREGDISKNLPIRGFYCGICNIYKFYGEKIKSHRKHQRAEIRKTESTYEQFICTICKVELIGPKELLIEHNSLSSHIKMEREMEFYRDYNLPQNITKTVGYPLVGNEQNILSQHIKENVTNLQEFSTSTPSDTSQHSIFLETMFERYRDSNDVRCGFYCKLCNCFGFYSESKHLHTKTKQHLQKVLFNHDTYVCEKFFCQPCKVDLFGQPDVLADHFVLSAHQKMSGLSDTNCTFDNKKNLSNSTPLNDKNFNTQDVLPQLKQKNDSKDIYEGVIVKEDDANADAISKNNSSTNITSKLVVALSGEKSLKTEETNNSAKIPHPKNTTSTQDVINDEQIKENIRDFCTYNNIIDNDRNHQNMMSCVAKSFFKMPNPKLDDIVAYLCEVCKESTASKKQWEEHIKSKIHKDQSVCNSLLFCKICRVSFLCTVEYFQCHLLSYGHRAIEKISKERQQDLLKPEEDEVASAQSDDESSSDKNSKGRQQDLLNSEEDEVASAQSDDESSSSSDETDEGKPINEETQIKTVPKTENRKPRSKLLGLIIQGFPPHTKSRTFYKTFFNMGFKVNYVHMQFHKKADTALVSFCSPADAEAIMEIKEPLIVEGVEVQITKYYTGRKDPSEKYHFSANLSKLFHSPQVLMGVIDRIIIRFSIVAEKELKKTNLLLSDIKNTLYDVKVYPFGSRMYGTSSATSDLDVFVDIDGETYFDSSLFGKPRQELTIIKNIAYEFKNCKAFYNVKVIAARVPIVRLIHRPTGLACDVSCKNGLSVENTQLTKCYLESDPRVSWLVTAVKYWANLNSLKDSSRFTSYALTWMVLYFLMQLEEPVVFPVQKLREQPYKRKPAITGWNCQFCTDVSLYPKTKNTQLVLELLHDFFVFYASLEHEDYVLCPIIGDAIHSDRFKNFDLPECFKSYVDKARRHRDSVIKLNKPICLQDPLDLGHNLTKNVKKDCFNFFKQLCIKSAKFIEEWS